MWNTHRVGVTADNMVRYTASSLTVVQYSLIICLFCTNMNREPLKVHYTYMCRAINLFVEFISIEMRHSV